MQPDQAVIKAIRDSHLIEGELYILMEEMCEGSGPVNRDQVSNILSGLIEINKLRVNKAEREYRFSVTNNAPIV